ncbi:MULTISPECIES: AAA family ATPase [Brevibacillus]|uniref:AAA family ATPase n=1 Tax=Brevibacillus TaxID=55080 RepID=UPI00156B845A|nr:MULTISPECIES: AAA family ATPase [Brevibacillus]UED68155.1 AAA family ATPase [Brevibacillus sp. HD3.3A]
MKKIELIKQMTINNPENASAWYLLGLEYAQTEKYTEALQAFTEALRCNDPGYTQQIIEELGKLSLAQTSAAVQSERVVHQEVATGGTDYDALHGSVDEKASEKVPVLTNARDLLVNKGEAEGTDQLFQIISGGQTGKKDRAEATITFADVGGLHAVKNAIQMKIVKPFVSPGLFERFRKKVGGGILLYGPPGCGKTFIAKATAGECRARFIPIHIADILDPYIGASEQNLREVFSSARATKPSVLFLDEMDALGYNRSRSTSNSMRAVIDTLLTEIEGIEANTDKMLIIGATNMPWDVDPAFKRPGRFDKMIFVSPPDDEARATIFQIKLQDRPMEQIDYALLAKETDLYSGADIENVIELAAEEVINEIMRTGVERPLTMQDLKNAIQSTQPSTIDWLRTVKNYVKYANQGGLYNDVESFLSRYKRI